MKDLPASVLKDPTPETFAATFEHAVSTHPHGDQIRADLASLRLTLEHCEGPAGYREFAIFRALGGKATEHAGIRLGWCTVGSTRYIRIENYTYFHGSVPRPDFIFWHGTFPERHAKLNERLHERLNKLNTRRLAGTTQQFLQPTKGERPKYREGHLPYEFREPRLIAASPDGILLADNRWIPTRGLLIFQDAFGTYREHTVPRRFVSPKAPKFRTKPASERLRAVIAWLLEQHLAGTAA
jgi:hypothetical protein